MDQFDNVSHLRTVPSNDQYHWPNYDRGAWDGPVREWWQEGFEELYLGACKNFRTVITAGANMGLYARQYAKRFDIVYGFEPDPLNFHFFTKNCQIDNVIKIQGALGRESGHFITVSRQSKHNLGMHQVIQHENGLIPLFSIDSFNFKNVDLIQLDVEGFEYNALGGAIETIKKHRPVIIVERFTDQINREILPMIGYRVDKTINADTRLLPL